MKDCKVRCTKSGRFDIIKDGIYDIRDNRFYTESTHFWDVSTCDKVCNLYRVISFTEFDMRDKIIVLDMPEFSFDNNLSIINDLVYTFRDYYDFKSDSPLIFKEDKIEKTYYFKKIDKIGYININ